MHDPQVNHGLLARTLWGHLRHADWRGAAAQNGGLGLLGECLRAVAGFASWPFLLPKQDGWTPAAVCRLLADHGVASWGWGYAGGEHFFHVKLRQAHWAQHLLLIHGVQLGGRLLAERQATGPTHRPAPTVQPARTQRLLDPSDRINRVVDQLANW